MRENRNISVAGTHITDLEEEYVLDALRNDALGASLSGSGPSFAAICHNQNVKKICKSWKTYSENIIVTDLNSHRGGHINE